MISNVVLPQSPVKNYLIIESLNKLTNFIHCTILDISGKVVIPDTIVEFCEGVVKISIESLQKGLYILHLSDDNSYFVNSFEVA